MKQFLMTIIIISLSFSLDGMYLPSRSSRAVSARAVRPVPASFIQKRTLYRPEKLPSSSLFTKQVQSLMPTIGAARYESGISQRMHSVKSESPAVKLVQELFHQQDGQQTPTASKSKAAYALSPLVMGWIIGALEAGVLHKSEVRESIIKQWKRDYADLTEGGNMTTRKIESLIVLIEQSYQQDKNNALSIILSFLYAKANPDSNHAMLHYFQGLSTYLTIFLDQPVEESLAKKTKEVSVIEKLKDLFSEAKKYMFTSQDYANTASELNKQRTISQEQEGDEAAQKAVDYASHYFEETIGAILQKKQISNQYPPKVVQSRYGYQGKQARPNCVEAAFHDLFNILLYNQKKQTFDLSLLPSTIKVHPDFIEFYNLQKDASLVNSLNVGEAFMNLVSDIPGVFYMNGNYELRGGSTADNFVILMNRFFNLNAANIEEIGSLLSDDRRKVTVGLGDHSKEVKKINIDIHNYQDDVTLKANFFFRQGHGRLEALERTKDNEVGLLPSYILTKDYNISSKAQALFSLQAQAHDLSWTKDEKPASFYYAFDVSLDYTRYLVINRILVYASNNNEAIDYAYHLVKDLSLAGKLDVMTTLSEIGIDEKNKKFKDIYRSIEPKTDDDWSVLIRWMKNYGHKNLEAVNYIFSSYKELSFENKLNIINKMLNSNIKEEDKKRIKDLYRTFEPTTDKEVSWFISWMINHGSSDQDMINYVFSFYKNLPDWLREAEISEIINSGIWHTNNFEEWFRVSATAYLVGSVGTNTFDVNTMETFFNKIDNQQEKNKFLATLLKLFSRAEIEVPEEDMLSITKKLLSAGSDVNSFSSGSLPPIFWAIAIGNDRLINLLIDSGANINYLVVSTNLLNGVKVTMSPLSFAIEKFPRKVDILLDLGADINQEITRHDGQVITPIMYAKEPLVDKLLDRGAVGLVNGRVFIPSKSINMGKKQMPVSASVHE